MNVSELEFSQFQRNYHESSLAQGYYKTRNLSQKLIEKNLIGFCPPYSRYEFSHLRGRLIVPIRNVYGDLIAMAGRQIPELKDLTVQAMWDSYGDKPAQCQNKIEKWIRGKWINEPYQKNKNLFFLDIAKTSARHKNYLLFTEGYFDVYSFYDKGLENVVAICGTAISEYQIALASRYCDNIVLLMDGDEPGFIASTKAAEKIKELGLNVIQIFLPPGIDPDDFARENDVDFLDKKILEMIESKKSKLYIRVNNG
jgi:DNA primase